MTQHTGTRFVGPMPGLVPTSVLVQPASDPYAREGALIVQPLWAYEGIDRPNVGGWVVRDREMADRLAAACQSGAAFGIPEVHVDVTGQTYIHAPHRVMGKYMNADLRKLGY